MLLLAFTSVFQSHLFVLLVLIFQIYISWHNFLLRKLKIQLRYSILTHNSSPTLPMWLKLPLLLNSYLLFSWSAPCKYCLLLSQIAYLHFLSLIPIPLIDFNLTLKTLPLSEKLLNERKNSINFHRKNTDACQCNPRCPVNSLRQKNKSTNKSKF